MFHRPAPGNIRPPTSEFKQLRQRRHWVQDLGDILEDRRLAELGCGGGLLSAFKNNAHHGSIAKRNHDACAGNH